MRDCIRRNADVVLFFHVIAIYREQQGNPDGIRISKDSPGQEREGEREIDRFFCLELWLLWSLVLIIAIEKPNISGPIRRQLPLLLCPQIKTIPPCWIFLHLYFVFKQRRRHDVSSSHWDRSRQYFLNNVKIWVKMYINKSYEKCVKFL